MKVLRVATALCVLSLFSLPARSQQFAGEVPITGNNLVVDCQGVVHAMDQSYSTSAAPNLFKAGICVGMVVGVGETLQVNNQFCPAQNVTVGQLIRIVDKFLQNHPAKLNQPGPVLTGKALKGAFPCKQ